MIGLIITVVITAIIASMCFVYSIFAFKGKGPILSNKYLVENEVRKELLIENPQLKVKEYRYAAITFLGISLMFLTMFLSCLLLLFHIHTKIVFIISIIIAVLLSIYTIILNLIDYEVN